MVKPDLSVRLGELELANPIMTASGTFGYATEFEQYYDVGKLGGFVAKGLSPKPRKGNPPPRIVETPSGMLNTIGLQNVGVDAFISDKLPPLRKMPAKVFANVFGETLAEYIVVCEKLNAASGVDALEINVSCPNVEKGGMIFGNSADGITQVTEACRAAAPDLPIFVKLSPNVTDITETARAAEGAGADGISLVNTFVGMAIDVDRRKPVLEKISGGLSGPAIRPLAVWLTYQVARAVKLPIIGMGGIMTANDALEFILAGATAVQVGTANFATPNAAHQVLQDLKGYLVDHKIDTVRELIGALETKKAPA